MRKVPISGGPHTGKSTLLEALRQKYPEAYFLPEPAEKIIARQLARATAEGRDLCAAQLITSRAFNEAVINEYLIQEASLPQQGGISFQDRSLIDSIAYCKLVGLDDLLPYVEEKIAAANYALAFFCEPVGTHTRTAIRSETHEEAQTKQNALREAYENSGIKVIILPSISIEERLVIVENTLLRIKEL